MGVRVATFDTHVQTPNLPGWASHSAAKWLRWLGCTLVAAPETFFVDGLEGPLLAGELERATSWGAQPAVRLAESVGLPDS